MDDAQIVQLYWDRNEEAIPVTARKYGSYCTAIAQNILGCHEDAEECVNDTYLSAWNTMPPQKPSVLSTFLGKITRNLSFNRYKHNTAQKRGGGEIHAVLDELSNCVSGKDDVEQAINYKELVLSINEFLSTMPAQKRNIFVCRYWYADSIASIADRFGMTQAAVSMTLNRLRNKLHNYLTDGGFVL